METLDIPTLRKIIVVKDALIATQQKLIAAQDSKIKDLEDGLAAANKVISECREFVNTLGEKERRFEDDLGRRHETTT